MKKLKNIFISAIHQNAGKTTLALGLYKNFQERKIRTAFMKPVGQETVTFGAGPVDKDSYLIGEVYHCTKRINDMSPVTVGRGYTEKYILNPQKEVLQEKILRSFRTLTKGKDAIIVEGTGHAGVGAVIDCSNADVASILGSNVIIVSQGGIGRSIDEIMLNKALFDLRGVPILGVVVNKVMPEKLEKIKNIVGKGLANKGIRLLGVIPETALLSTPTVEQIKERLDLKVFSGGENLQGRVYGAIAAAIESLTSKIQKTDKDKIHEAHRLVKDYVNVDMILENL